MLPAKPPLPTPCSRLFQLSAGSQTSILISESALGVAVICTRQKAGRDLKMGSGPSPSKWGSGGGVKAPAGIAAAEVTFAEGSEISVSCPQEAAEGEADCAEAAMEKSRAAAATRRTLFMRPPARELVRWDCPTIGCNGSKAKRNVQSRRISCGKQPSRCRSPQAWR